MSTSLAIVAGTAAALFVVVTTVVSIWISIIARLVWAKRDRDRGRQRMGW